jgi:putative transposase
VPEIVAFVDEHRPRFGVEPICRMLTEHGCKIASNSGRFRMERRALALKVGCSR